jgi:hypothetical protein
MNNFSNEISILSNYLLSFFNQIFSKLNTSFIIEFNGVSISYGWLVVGFLVIGILISVFWKGGRA